MLFALMGVIWGIPYLMIKVAVEGVSVPVLVFARTALGAAVLLPVALGSGRLAELRRLWRPLLAFAALEIMIPWWLLSDAERHLTSSMTGLLIAASPIIAAVAARLAGDAEPLGIRRLTGLAVGLAGVAALAAPELRGGDLGAVSEVLLTATCYAIGPRIAARRLSEANALSVTAAALAVSALVYLPAAALTWPEAVPSGQVLAALGGLGLVCTALAFLVFFALIQEAGPARALVFTYVNPAVAVIAGVLLLDEPLTASILGAFVLILCGSVLATSSTPATTPAATSAATVPGPTTVGVEPGETFPATARGGEPDVTGPATALSGETG